MVNLTPLAESFVNKQIKPKPQPAVMWQLGHMPEPQKVPATFDPDAAAMMATLLGGTVVNLIPQVAWLNNEPNTADAKDLDSLPRVPFVRLASGAVIQAVDVFDVSKFAYAVPGLKPLACVEWFLLRLVPDGQVSDDTQGQMDNAPYQSIFRNFVPPTPIVYNGE